MQVNQINQIGNGQDNSTRLTNKLNNAVVLTALLVTLALVLSPDTAFAQGQGQALFDYTYEEYGRPLLNLGVVAVAMTMFFLRFSFGTVGTVAAGGMTFANYDSITALFGA